MIDLLCKKRRRDVFYKWEFLMQSYDVKLKKQMTRNVVSRLFSAVNWPMTWPSLPAGYTFFFQLVLHDFSDDSGILYCFINQDHEDDYLILYYPHVDGLAYISLHQKGYIMIFNPTANDFDGMKVFGEPAMMNVFFKKDDILLFQYDPYACDDATLFFGLDGYVYLMIHEKDFKQKHFHKAYLVIDRL